MARLTLPNIATDFSSIVSKSWIGMKEYAKPVFQLNPMGY